MLVLTIQNSVPNWVFGMPDFPYLEHFIAKWERDSGLTLCSGRWQEGGRGLLGFIFAGYVSLAS